MGSPTEDTLRDIARLAGERDDLISRLNHLRSTLDAVLARADAISVTALAEAAGLTRESVYQAIARHQRAQPD